MNKYVVNYVLTLFLLSFFKVNAQKKSESEYLQIEQNRIEQVQKIEIEIEEFIRNNTDSYQLTDELIHQISNSKSCVGDQPFVKTLSESLSEEEFKSRIDEVKKAELRKLYFTQHKENEVFYQATSNERFIDCINGGFESGIANYTFATMNLSPSQNGPGTGWNGINTVMTGVPPGVVGLNQYNTSNASLVSPGNEPFLASLGVIVPKVLNGNRAIKLNATEINNNDYDITTMTRQVTINDNFMDVNFSLIMDNPGHPSPNFFRITVYDLQGTIVDQVFIQSDPANCLYQSVASQGRTILYTNWICARLNVGQVLNQQATVEFMIADCGWSGHFSTVYIDDICGASSNCSNPRFGSINLDPVNGLCPVFPQNVCGTYQLPPGSTLGNISLDILQGGVAVGTITATSQLTGSTFCFQVNASDFPSQTGVYEYRVNATFIIACPSTNFNWNVSDTSTNVGPDVDFTLSETITNIQYSAGNVSWANTASSYAVEIVADPLCCGPNAAPFSTVYYTYVSSANSFNGLAITNIIQRKCYRWRAKPNTACGDWSEWCCVSSDTNYTNPYQNQGFCHPVPPCPGEYDLYIATNVTSGSTSIENVDGRITAVNTIFPNSNVSYFAGNQIILTSSTTTPQSFHAQSGANFLARIQPCTESIVIPRVSNDKTFIENSDERTTLVKIHKENSIDQDFIRIYPNPTSFEVNISTNTTQIIGVELIDSTGKLVQTFDDVYSLQTKIDVSGITKGIYFLRIKTQKEGVYIEKLIIM